MMAESDAAEVKVRSEGQRQLLALTVTRDAIAETVGVSGPLVTYWRRGKNLPGSAARAALHEHFGIHPTAWNRLPGTPGTVVADALSAAGRPTIDLVNERINLYATMVTDEELDYEMRLRAGELERKCIAERRGLERDARAREADVVARSPEWANVRRRTLDVLKQHPEALRAWVDAMGVYAREAGGAAADEEEDEET